MTNEKNSLKIVLILASFMGLLSVALIIFLNAYVLLIADLLPAAISSAYLMLIFKKQKKESKGNNNNTLPIPFIFFGLMVIPLTITIIASIVYSFEIYLLVISFVMPLTFMNIFFYLPMAIYDKYFKKRMTLPSLIQTLTVIVPAFNEELNIKRTIDSIIEADYPNKEIIVVDDGSTDQTYTIVSKYLKKFPNSRFSLIRKQNGGKASAINLALRFAKGEIVIVVDADSIIERNTLQEISKELQHPGVIAVAGKVKVLNRSNILTNCIALEVAMGVNLLRPPFSLFGVVMIVPGALGGFRKDAMLQRGLYDKDTLTEDFDMTIKLLKTGGTIVGIPSISYTEVPSTLEGLYRQRTRWNRGNFQTLIKHKDIMTTTRYGMLQKFGYPITLSMFLIPPFLDIIVSIFAVLAILGGIWMPLIIPFVLFVVLQLLLSAIAVVLDGKEDWRLILYSPFAIIGYKQIINFIIIKSIFDVLFCKNLRWATVRHV